MVVKKQFVITASLFALVFLFSFNISPQKEFSASHSINLRWVMSYPGETWEQVRTGMLWNLSFLGAGLPKGSADAVVIRTDSTHFQLDLAPAGFGKNALAAFSVIIDSLKNTEEYVKHNSIDAGRFVMLTLNSSWHYYQITGAESSLKKFIQKYDFEDHQEFPIMNSSVGKHNRLIKFSNDERIERSAFIAEEGVFDTLKMKMKTGGFEVMDIMPNGQLRFAVYDAKGKLIDGSPAEQGIAGKPGKCVWCHEVNIQVDFKNNVGVGHFMGALEFNKRMNIYQDALNKYRASLNSEINFEKKQEHTYGEFLYLCFMEPSAQRLAQEWGQTDSAVLRKVAHIPVHRSAEFAFLDKIYHRAQIDSFAPFRSAAIPAEHRETGGFEPNYFKKNKKQNN